MTLGASDDSDSDTQDAIELSSDEDSEDDRPAAAGRESDRFEDVFNSGSFGCESEDDSEVYKKPSASRTLDDSDIDEEVERTKAASKFAPAASAAGPVIKLGSDDDSSVDWKADCCSRTPPPPAAASAR